MATRIRKTPKLDAAFIAAQAEMEPATRNARNEDIGKTYADQEEIHRRARVLLAHGIGYRQDVVFEGGIFWARVVLVHDSGETREHRNPICATPSQGGHKWEAGSTYAHRVCLGRAVGLAIGSDDDGNMVSPKPQQRQQQRRQERGTGPDPRPLIDAALHALRSAPTASKVRELRDHIMQSHPDPRDPVRVQLREPLARRLEELERAEAADQATSEEAPAA